MTNRMAKLDRKTNEAIASIFSLYLAMPTKSSDLLTYSGQRLQSMKKGQDPTKEVDLVASINAAEKERGAGADDGAASDEE